MPITVKCLVCSKEFFVKPAIIRLGKGKFCSKKCFYTTKKGRPIPQLYKSKKQRLMTCKSCGKRFHADVTQIKRGRGKFCSMDCYNVGKKGRMPPNYRGWHINDAGYVLVYSPKHPHCNAKKNVRRSRLVMEKHLGRFLRPEEVVHHKDGNKQNDRITNLKLFENNGMHHRLSHNLARNKLTGQFVKT